jgi:RNA polymerase sigma-70 factor (ECF subfamily)
MSYESSTDVELATTGWSDPEAFAELYRRHVDRVVAFATRRSNTPADAADLVAATFLVGLESLKSYDPRKGDPLPWLLGIARRLAMNRGRRRNREWAAANRLQGQRLLDDDDFMRLERQIDANRLSARLESALSKLKPQDREALLLVGYDRLAPDDAATVLGLRSAAFRMRLSRARRALRSQLDDPHHDVALRRGVRLKGEVAR